ncbi:MAG: hypothetical protein DMG26_12210 [Acidobacteria bacterium]|nr:MAG: hypothetical protein DMG25_11850 [Acidobacteriota bacterium]PYV02068.1 MAG: hypothetical protein DMG26_12210 [Acidobacteriota bacterium]PYV27718.1 MAG: hypothetical protein DMG27_03225 [Acidobacteriota bacterium]
MQQLGYLGGFEADRFACDDRGRRLRSLRGLRLFRRRRLQGGARRWLWWLLGSGLGLLLFRRRLRLLRVRVRVKSDDKGKNQNVFHLSLPVMMTARYRFSRSGNLSATPS